MRVSKRGQITIPKILRDQFGFGYETEIEFKPTAEGLLITRHGDHAEEERTNSSNQKLSSRALAAIQLMERRIHTGATGVDIVTGILDSDALGEGVTVDEFCEGMVDDYVASAERIYQTEPHIVGDRLDSISCPTLIVQGEDDDWAGVRHARMIRDSIRGAELDVLPGVGHEAHREDPEAFNRRLQGFLASLEE